eukprot:scaffold562_cov227-Pinguiococcus_pyrenoidosus.AAC.6
MARVVAAVAVPVGHVVCRTPSRIILQQNVPVQQAVGTARIGAARRVVVRNLALESSGCADRPEAIEARQITVVSVLVGDAEVVIMACQVVGRAQCETHLAFTGTFLTQLGAGLVVVEARAFPEAGGVEEDAVQERVERCVKVSLERCIVWRVDVEVAAAASVTCRDLLASRDIRVMVWALVDTTGFVPCTEARVVDANRAQRATDGGGKTDAVIPCFTVLEVGAGLLQEDGGRENGIIEIDA